MIDHQQGKTLNVQFGVHVLHLKSQPNVQFGVSIWCPLNADASTLVFHLCRTWLCRSSNLLCAATAAKSSYKATVSSYNFIQMLWQARALEVKCFLRMRVLM